MWTKDDDLPFVDFFMKLQQDDAERVNAYIGSLCDKGLFIMQRDRTKCKRFVGAEWLGLYELKPKPYRVIFAVHDNDIVLLHGYKVQHTTGSKMSNRDMRELDRARNRWRSYLNQM